MKSHYLEMKITEKKERVLICNYKLPYFFGYKMEFFSFQNNPKNLDPSYKMNQIFGIV